MRTSVKLLSVCAAAPAVALCVGAPIAWAAPSTTASVTPQTTNGSLSVSAGGNSLLQLGNESKATTTGSSLAVAFNIPGTKGSLADANGTGNFVVAGNDSVASATGNFNMVQAMNGSAAHVTGNLNMVRAINHSQAVVTGNNNTVAALCGGSAEVPNMNNPNPNNQIVLAAPCIGH